MIRLFLTILFCILSIHSYADRTGTLVISPVTVGASSNTFASAYCDEINGCNHAVADITARDAITSARRAVGLEITVLSNNTKYRLEDGITNSDWVEISPDAGAGWEEEGSVTKLQNQGNNVGVGTSLPVTKFQVKGGDTTVDALNILGGGTVGTFASTGGFGFDSANNPYVSPKVYIDTTGNVGVGTTLPNYKFDVNGGMQAASGNFSGEGAFIQGANFTVDFDDGGAGVLRMSSTNIEGGNNQSVDFDLATTEGTLNILSPTGATHTNLFGDLTVADRVASPILQAGTEGSGTFDVSGTVVAQFLMEEITGTTLDNFEGTSAYDGTSSASLSGMTTTGKIDNGLNFDGTKTIDLGSNSGLKFVHDMSVCVWVKSTGLDKNIAGNRSNSTPYNGWRLAITSTGLPFFLVDGGSTNTASITGGVLVNNDAWNLVCGTRKEGEGIKIYVNAALAGNSIDLSTYDIGTNAGNTKIGDIPLTSLANGDPYVGLIDNFAVYDSALTQAQITGLYNNGLGINSLSGGAISSIGCLLMRDEDGLGYTELHTLDGIGRFSQDTNGACDGI